MDLLVSADWLLDHVSDPDLVVLDCSVHFDPEGGGLMTRSGQDDYTSGHIPGARFADLYGELSDADSQYEFAVPAPEQFAAAMEALGVSDGTRVVLYDRMMSMWAARVWWMLRWIGFDDAALLDGGLAAWEAAGGTLVDEVPAPEPGRLTIDLRPHLIVDQDQVKAAIDDPGVALVDSLTPELYRGEMPMYHDRAGHIPSAANVSALALVDENGRFVGLDDLAELHDGYDRQARTITYCGGGIAASAGAFAMTRLGFSDVAVYAASLQEWAGDPSNPLVVGGD